MLMDINISKEEDNINTIEQYQLITEYRYLHAITTLSMLNDHSVFHTVTSIDIFNDKPIIKDIYNKDKSLFLQLYSLMHKVFTLNCYLNQVFQGIMPDIEIVRISTARISQIYIL